MRFLTTRAAAICFAWSICLLNANVTQAHFIWLVPQADGQTVAVYFGEDATPGDPEYLTYVEGMQAWSVKPLKSATKLELKRTPESLSARQPGLGAGGSLVIAKHDLGVMERGDSRFLLKYYAKAGADVTSAAWQNVDCSQLLSLDVRPRIASGQVSAEVRLVGKPCSGAEVTIHGPGIDELKAATDEQGIIEIPAKLPGVYSVRVRAIEPKKGESDGKPYDEVRHYTTVALTVPETAAVPVIAAELAPIPEPVTSFGAAILDQAVYTYGGHTGGAHSYSHAEQGHTLRRLDLRTGQWTELAEGPHLQGLALLGHGQKLYRLGGFTAKNAEGEDHDLWSQTSAAAYDLQSKKWVELPALPEARSSFDAAILDGKIYVVGGWSMAGDADSVWHKTAWVMDPTSAKPEWKKLPEPPFRRRALAVAAFNHKLYAIGGMAAKGGPSRRVDIFDPASGEWTQGPDLQGEGRMAGFGSSSFATGGRLYTSTIDGDLQRLSSDGKSWEIIGKTPTARFFHRMLPLDDHRLLMVGGSNMSIGKFEEVEVIDVRSMGTKVTSTP